MSTVVNTNVSSLTGIANLMKTNRGLQGSLEKLSSGLKINKAADDSSGLAIASKMQAQIGGIRQAISNAGDGISLIQTADGALAETDAILLRMRDLAVKASNDATLTTADLQKIDTEFQALISEVNAKSTRVTFNTKQIFNSKVNGAKLQIGPDAGHQISIPATLTTISSTALKVNAKTVSTQANAQAALAAVDSGLGVIANLRSDLGTIQRRLGHIVNDLTATDINLSAARSRIMDTDFASEISNFTKLQILQQVGTAVLAQANASPQAVIQLLG